MLYTELDVVCLLLLVYVAVRSHSHVEKRESWIFFQAAVYFIMLFVTSDLVWNWMENDILMKPLFLSYLVNWCYFLFCMAGIASWFLYAERELETKLVKKKYFVFIVASPIFLTLFLLVMNNYTHCLFYFDENGCYKRGAFNVSGFLIPCLYLGFCVVHSLLRAFRKENYVKRRHYLNLAVFALPSAIAALLQVFIESTPLPCIGLSASILLVYMNSQDLLVSIDPLTKLSNRHFMIRYLNNKIEHFEHKTHLYLLLLDLNKFKHINDTYGHIEGDHALVRFASVLKDTVSEFNCFASRYGGDEFIIIYETESPEDLRRLCRFIHKKLDESNLASQKEYTLSTSIGYAEYKGNIHYVPELIALADQALYEAKKNRKQ